VWIIMASGRIVGRGAQGLRISQGVIARWRLGGDIVGMRLCEFCGFGYWR
jgi:hypothetical protein